MPTIMPDIPKRSEYMLFNYETTYRTDYRDGAIKDVIRTDYKPRPMKPRPPAIRLKDIQALFPLRDSEVPFHMYHKPNPVTRTNPWIVQATYERPIDTRRVEVQKTRPKVILTPALPLDEIEEPTRQTLVDFIYKTTVIKAMDEAIALTVKRKDIRAPLSPVYAPARPVKLEPLRHPYVPPEWRLPSVSWDSKQLRTYTEPTKTFWLSRTPNCSVCRDTAAVQAHRKLMCHLKSQK